MSLKFAGAKVGDEALALDQADAEELEVLALPVAEFAPCEVGVVENRVETFCGSVVGIIIARGIKERSFEANPVAVDGEFERGHLGVDILRCSRDRVHAVSANSPVEGIRDVDPSDMPLPCHPEVIGFDAVWLVDADGIGTSQEVVLVEVEGGLVVVVVKAQFCRVAWEDEVLAIVVGDEDVLMSVVEGVEKAVGVFLDVVEEDQVELISVGEPGPEETNAAVGVAEDEAAEVAVEVLVSCPDGHEVVVGAEVCQFVFEEVFLEGDVIVDASRPFADIGVYDGQFIGIEIVEVEDGSEAKLPVGGFEGGVAVEEVEAEFEEVGRKVLVWVAEEIFLVGMSRTFEGSRRDGELSIFLDRLELCGEVHEDVLADDRVVPFEDVLVVRVVPVPFFIRVIDVRIFPAFVAVPWWITSAPAIIDGDKVGRVLLFGRENAGRTCEAVGGVEGNGEGRVIEEATVGFVRFLIGLHQVAERTFENGGSREGMKEDLAGDCRVVWDDRIFERA